MTRFDLMNGGLYQPPKFPPLFLGDGRSQILNLGSMLPYEDDQRYLRNSADPGIADELRIERKQTFGVLWVAARRGLPVDQATHAIYLTDRIEIGNKFAASNQCLKFYLEILAWVVDANPIVPCEPLQQMNSLMY